MTTDIPTLLAEAWAALGETDATCAVIGGCARNAYAEVREYRRLVDVLNRMRDGSTHVLAVRASGGAVEGLVLLDDVLLALLTDAEHAVLVDLQSLLLGAAAEFDVVLFGTGEVLQCGTERGPRHDAQIDLQPAAKTEKKPAAKAPAKAPLTAEQKEKIAAQQAAYRAGGGRFIVPIPTPQVV